MTYYYAGGAPMAGVQQVPGEKPGLYGTYNGQMTVPVLPIPVPRPPNAMAGQPFMQHPIPQPGGPPPQAMRLAGASPVAAPSPLAAATPGASPLQPNMTQLQPGINMYPPSGNNAAPIYVATVPTSMYAAPNTGYLPPGTTMAHPQPTALPPSAPQQMPIPQVMPTNPYMGRPIQPYPTPSATGQPISSAPMMPGTQYTYPPGSLPQQQPPQPQTQQPVFSAPGGFAMAPMPSVMYASPTQPTLVANMYPQPVAPGYPGMMPTQSMPGLVRAPYPQAGPVNMPQP